MVVCLDSWVLLWRAAAWDRWLHPWTNICSGVHVYMVCSCMWLAGMRGRVRCGWVLCSHDCADGPAAGVLCCSCLLQGSMGAMTVPWRVCTSVSACSWLLGAHKCAALHDCAAAAAGVHIRCLQLLCGWTPCLAGWHVQSNSSSDP